MNSKQTLREIDTSIPEGKMLLSALAILTTTSNLSINGKKFKGTEMTPDDMTAEVAVLSETIYKNQEEE